MALFECRKKSEDAKTEYMYYSSIASGTFTDSCEIGDIYLAQAGSNASPTIVSGLELITNWQSGSQSYYRTFMYRATATSVELSFAYPLNFVRISKGGKEVSYDLLDLTPDVTLTIPANKGDVLCFPFNSSSLTYTMVSNIEKMSDLQQSTKYMSMFKATGTSVEFKNSSARKIVRFY